MPDEITIDYEDIDRRRQALYEGFDAYFTRVSRVRSGRALGRHYQFAEYERSVNRCALVSPP